MQMTMPDANKKQTMALTLIETFDDRRHWIESDFPTILDIRSKYPRLFDFHGSMVTFFP